MKFKIKENDRSIELEGRAAYPVLRRLMQKLSRQIYVPEPPYTTKVRKRAMQALRRGEVVSDGWDQTAQPNGDIIVRQVR